MPASLAEIAFKGEEMNRYWLSAVALAVSGVPAVASVPQTSLNALPAVPVVAAVTGLTAADLIVGLDGTVAVDVGARGANLAACSANNNCTNICC
jgi:hypothetical protein